MFSRYNSRQTVGWKYDSKRFWKDVSIWLQTLDLGSHDTIFVKSALNSKLYRLTAPLKTFNTHRRCNKYKSFKTAMYMKKVLMTSNISNQEKWCTKAPRTKLQIVKNILQNILLVLFYFKYCCDTICIDLFFWHISVCMHVDYRVYTWTRLKKKSCKNVQPSNLGLTLTNIKV